MAVKVWPGQATRRVSRWPAQSCSFCVPVPTTVAASRFISAMPTSAVCCASYCCVTFDFIRIDYVPSNSIFILLENSHAERATVLNRASITMALRLDGPMTEGLSDSHFCFLDNEADFALARACLDGDLAVTSDRDIGLLLSCLSAVAADPARASPPADAAMTDGAAAGRLPRGAVLRLTARGLVRVLQPRTSEELRELHSKAQAAAEKRVETRQATLLAREAQQTQVFFYFNNYLFIYLFIYFEEFER